MREIQKAITYAQNWPIYDKSQEEEKIRFLELLHGLVQNVDEPDYEFGRPKVPVRDLLFSLALKVYSQMSLRRFISDLKMAKDKAYVTHDACFASIGHFMQKRSTTALLNNLITLSAMPLQDIENKFAVDSTGFKTTKFGEYCRQKHHLSVRHKWLKAHVCCGVYTNIVVAVKVGDEYSGDSPQFVPLAKSVVKKGFKIEEITADKAYSSGNNLQSAWDMGAIPFIPFKKNARIPEGGNAWSEMYGFFLSHQREFMHHYHLRSNVESTFFMIKTKFGETLKNKTKTAQINELLLKILCHNIVVLIHEMNGLGIEPDFQRGCT